MKNYSNFRTLKDKTAIRFITAFGLNMLFITACIWGIAEFILYLTKDNPFNWWSVIAAVIIMVLYLINIIRIIRQ